MLLLLVKEGRRRRREEWPIHFTLWIDRPLKSKIHTEEEPRSRFGNFFTLRHFDRYGKLSTHCVADKKTG